MKHGPGLALLLVLAACVSAPPRAPETVQLTRAAFTDLPGWNDAGQDAARAAFRASCAVLAKKPDDAAMGAAYAGRVADWRQACAAPDGADFFARNFTPYRVAGEGLFTGYYVPEIAASRTRHGPYQTPVYGLPPDLVRADLGLFDAKLKGEHISGRVQGHALVPYADRAAIETAGLDAPVLFWAADPVAFFFLQIQGSGVIALDDGTRTAIAYAGENGRAYTAIGRTLIARGELARADVSLQAIRAWLLAHPDQAAEVMRSNASYVFFREGGAQGSQGTALTPLGSLAVDLRQHALGVPMYVAADPVHALLVAQDTGGAIRGPVRGDVFFGAGEEAEARAGAMKAQGQLYVLLPNDLAARLGDRWP